MVSTSHPSKSRTFRVATAAPRTRAMAAIWQLAPDVVPAAYGSRRWLRNVTLRRTLSKGRRDPRNPR